MFKSACSHYTVWFGCVDPSKDCKLSRMLTGLSKTNKVKTRETRAFTTQQILELAKYTENKKKSFAKRRTAFAVILSFLAFLGVSEASSLKMSDIKFAKMTLTIEVTKAKRLGNGFTAIVNTETKLGSIIRKYLK